MNRTAVGLRSMHCISNKCRFYIGLILILAPVLVIAQATEKTGGDLQQKVAAAKQAAAQNQQKLHQYQWTETTQLTLKGEAKPPTLSACRYGPDGKVQKTALGPPPEAPSGGKLGRCRITWER